MMIDSKYRCVQIESLKKFKKKVVIKFKVGTSVLTTTENGLYFSGMISFVGSAIGAHQFAGVIENLIS